MINEAPIKRGRGRPPKSLNKPITPKKQDHTRLPVEMTSDNFVGRGRGKETYYQPWMCDKIIEVAANGGFRSAMIVALGVKRRATINEWCNKYPEFKQAYELAKEYQQAKYEKLNLDMIEGNIKGNATSMAIALTNQFSDDYKRTGSGESVGNTHTEININTISLTQDQMDASIQQKLQFIKTFGIDYIGTDIKTIEKQPVTIEQSIIEEDEINDS